MNDRRRWNEKYRAGQGPDRINARLQKYLHLLKRGRALDLAGGTGQNARLLADAGWHVVLADISEEALARAPSYLARVQSDALALPFVSNSFDTIICTYFFEPRVDFASLLTPRGTLFFETYTLADAKYRPEFHPAHRFDPAQISKVFKNLEILLLEEMEDGHRVFATLIALNEHQ
jgi:SAM-dependent methyltransferase